MATPLPPEIIALRDRYQQAQIRLLEIIAEKEARGNLTAYRRGILDAVNAEIGNLDKFAREWVKSNIPRYYAAGASAAYKAFKDAGEDVARTAINTRVVQNLVDNATDMLIDAHQFVGRRIRDAVRKAGIEAIAEKVATGSTVNETKRRLIETLTKQGIPAVIDKRGRAIQLDTYAETVARTTTREATNKASIAEVEELGGDLVQMTQRFSTCPVCAVLEGRVYSISGNTPGYPPLSQANPNGYALPHPNCRHSYTPYFADMDASAEATQEMSNRPFEIDERAKASIAAYNREQQLKAARTKNRREWQRAKTADPTNAPKTASAYAAMKRANSARYQELKKSM